MLTLGFILETLTDYRATGREPAISRVVIDSRQATPGSMFVAFAGEQADGHDYVAHAFAQGATMALLERPLVALAQGAVFGDDYAVLDLRQPLPSQIPSRGKGPPLCLLVENTMVALQALAKAWRSRFPVRVVGITGSIGKTTTKELAHAVLAQRFHALKSEGNYNNEIGLPLTLLNLRPEYKRAVLEMGMYDRGEIALLCDIAKPQIGVVTMIGPVHLERLGSMDAIIAAKRELVEALPPAPEGIAILNKDDFRVMSMLKHTQARVFTYGLDTQADLWANDIHSMGLEGIKFTLHYGRETLRNISVPLLGRHSVHTSLRAAAVGLVEGMKWDEIIAGLQGLTSQLRLVAVPGPKNSVIIDDTYNSSPSSAIAALNLLADLNGRRVAVLGDMLELGAAEEMSHRLVGRRAMSAAHVLVAVGPRGRLIGEEALAAGMPAAGVHIAPDAEAAAAILEKIIEPHDMILIKGSRGAHLDRVVAALGRD